MSLRTDPFQESVHLIELYLREAFSRTEGVREVIKIKVRGKK